MKKRPLFYFILLSFWLLNIVSILSVTNFAYQKSEKLQNKVFENNLNHQLNIFKALISEAWEQTEPEKYILALCKSYRAETDIIFSVVMPNGKEIKESIFKRSSLEALGERTEVQQSFQGLKGKSKRFDAASNTSFLHLSIPLRNKSNEITSVLRASASLKEMESTLSDFKESLYLTCSLLLFISFILSYFICTRITKPIKELVHIARKISGKNYESRVPLQPIKEMNELAESLNHISETLTDNLSTLNEQEAEQKAILSSMNEGILAIDRKERIVHMNKAAYAILEIDPNMSIHRRLMQEIIRNSQVQEFAKRLLLTNNTISKQIKYFGNTEKYLQINGSQLTYPDKEDIGALIVIRDVSNVRYLEKIRSDFVSNVSHELKTPITSIRGFIETLSSENFKHDEKTSEYLNIIHQQSQRLQSIVDDLLTLSRLERKDGHVVKKENSIADTISTAISICQLDADKNNIQIAWKCEGNLTALINRNLIEQALVNVINNAIKYSDPNKKISINAFKQDSEIQIEIADEGFGIELKHHDRLFERFYRIDSARSRNMGGTGLGLSIVKHIIQNHNGKIEFKSTPGEGSTFKISFSAILTED